MTNRITEFEDAYQKRRVVLQTGEDEALAQGRPHAPRTKPSTDGFADDHLREPVYRPPKT